jgi:hypothetical protein
MHPSPVRTASERTLLLLHLLVFGAVMLAAVWREPTGQLLHSHLLTTAAQEGTSDAGALSCNGAAVLCDRRVDQVMFAATHNSMSSEADGWLWPNQASGLRDQLESGIRGFLIDAHYWESPGMGAVLLSRVPAGLRLAFLTHVVRWHPNDVYLCHHICAAGATRLTDTLREVDRFLDAHPDQVVILDIEDHVRPQDAERSFRDSGLLDRVFVHELGTPWPTLRELIEQRRQVIVEAENGGRANTWYGPMYREAWDTSYRVAPSEPFSCARERGNTSQALLLLNHWVTRNTPSTVDAATINSESSLLQHVEECVTATGKTPNLLAVDFAAVGDLVRTVAKLNGVLPEPSSLVSADPSQ